MAPFSAGAGLATRSFSRNLSVSLFLGRSASRIVANSLRHAGGGKRTGIGLHGRIHRFSVPVLFHWRVRNRFRLCRHRGHLILGRLVDTGVTGDMANILGPFVLFAKLMAVAFLMFWVRFTYPRLREDQLQSLAWKVLIPIGLINILITGILKVAI